MTLNEVKQELDKVTKMGDIKKIAKSIKVDHELALTLWDTGNYHDRLLSVLIFDKKQISEELLEKLAKDMEEHSSDEMNQISGWLLANQLMKDKKLSKLMTSWQHHNLPVLRRLFWYYQARLRWTGKTEYDNTEALLNDIEKDIKDEEPDVQWTMNYLAAQIGIFVPELRERCVNMGKEIGLYKGEKVSKGCTPAYLPEFIRIEVEKRNK